MCPIDFTGFIPRSFDAVVDAAGGGDYTTLQDADDALVDGYNLFVKQGTYAAGATIATHGATVFCESGTVVQAAVILSGDKITWKFGSGSDLQAIVTLSGDGCQLLCRNGVDLDGVVMSGDKGLVDGGGWDTLTIVTSGDALILSGDDCIARNISAQTATGGSAGDAIVMSGARASLVVVKVLDSDDDAVLLSGTDGFIISSIVLGADAIGIDVTGPRARILDTHVIATAGVGISLTATSDNSLLMGNIVKDQGAGVDAVLIDALGENCVVVGNRVDDLGTANGITDNSGTSTIANNDETAF